MTTYTINATNIGNDYDSVGTGCFMANLKTWAEVEKQVARAMSYGLVNITVKVVQH